ncbi:hypothetical protein ACFL17_04555 [Pseudomonadota bacterium]
MFIYFEFEQEYREKMADCFEVDLAELDDFFAELESEIGWYISLGGLRNSELSAKETSAYLEALSNKSSLLLEHLQKLPANIFGWLVDSVPLGVNYREPFKNILPLLQQIAQFSRDANDNIDQKTDNISQVSCIDLTKRIARCYDSYSETPIDIRTDLFLNYTKIVFDAIGTDDDPQKIIQKAIKQERGNAALAAKKAAPVRPKRKPLGRPKETTQAKSMRSKKT